MDNQYVYNLFLRNWINGTANEPEIDAAVTKNLITAEQAETIKSTTINAA